jgi:hypothetical protein
MLKACFQHDADPSRPPRVMTLDVPPPPLPLPPQPRLDFGHRVRRHAHPAETACSGVHSRSVLRFASGFFPTRPRGASIARLTTDHAARSCLRLTVATNSPREGLAPPIQCPCRAHLRPATTGKSRRDSQSISARRTTAPVTFLREAIRGVNVACRLTHRRNRSRALPARPRRSRQGVDR